MKNTEFFVAGGPDLATFTDEVNDKLKKGWELHGFMQVVNQQDGVYFVQAMLKDNTKSPGMRREN